MLKSRYGSFMRGQPMWVSFVNGLCSFGIFLGFGGVRSGVCLRIILSSYWGMCDRLNSD